MMWKHFGLGLLAAWLVEWIIDRRYWRRARGSPIGGPAVGGTASIVAPAARAGPATKADPASRADSDTMAAESGRDATTAGTGAGTVSGRIAMGAPGAVSTSSATLYSHASVYRQVDLEAIPGLGPRVGAALRDNGIASFAQLAATPPSELERLVRGAGGDPHGLGIARWTELATLAAGHDWAGFAALAERHRGREAAAPADATATG